MSNFFCFMGFSLLNSCLIFSLYHFVVEDTTNLPPSPPPSPAAEHFGPLEQGRLEINKFVLTLNYEYGFSFFPNLKASGVL